MKLILQLIVVLILGGALSYYGLSWLNRSQEVEPEVLPPGDQAVLLVESRGCVACHTIDGSAGVGPTWLGSWGKPREFTDGSTGIVDEAYLRESMAEPGVKVVKGYDKIMLPAQFTEEEMQLIIGLIRDMTLYPAE